MHILLALLASLSLLIPGAGAVAAGMIDGKGTQELQAPTNGDRDVDDRYELDVDDRFDRDLDDQFDLDFEDRLEMGERSNRRDFDLDDQIEDIITRQLTGRSDQSTQNQQQDRVQNQNQNQNQNQTQNQSSVSIW